MADTKTDPRTVPTKTHYKKQIESDYLGQWDLPDGRDVTVVIEGVPKLYVPQVRRQKRMSDGTYKKEPLKRYAIRFVGKRKAWLSGPVTQKTIAEMFGPYLEDWAGKKIALYVDHEVTMGRTKTGGIRVRNMAPKAEPDADPLDNEVDAEREAIIAAARAEAATAERDAARDRVAELENELAIAKRLAVEAQECQNVAKGALYELAMSARVEGEAS